MRRNNVVRMFGVALVLSPHASGAAQARSVGFGAARAAAERLAPEVRIAASRVGVSRAQIDVAGALDNPTLSVQSASRTARLGTSLSVPLPLFGRRGTAVSAAEADAAVSEREATLARAEARAGATLAWVDLWQAQERVRLLDLAARDAGRLFGIASERFDAGMGARVDVVRARASQASAQADLATARASVRAAALRLAPWIGGEGQGEIGAEGEIAYPAALPALDVLAREQPEHPELRRDDAALRAADARLRAEERQRWPVVNAEVGVNVFDPTLPGPDFFGGVSFEVPFLSLRGGAIARAHAEHALAAAEQDADALRLRAELEAAYREAEAAAAQVQSLRGEVVPALTEAGQMTEEGYRNGRVDLVRLLEAQAALREGRLSEVEAIATWGRALAQMERALGRALDAGTRVSDAH